MAHSIENDYSNPPSMILKVDIEKAYNTLEWKVILATLTKMSFLKIWVSWIKACISSASFSFINNGILAIGSTLAGH